jgi:hypothetical protein
MVSTNGSTMQQEIPYRTRSLSPIVSNFKATLNRSSLISSKWDVSNRDRQHYVREYFVCPKTVFSLGGGAERLKILVISNYKSKEHHKLYSSPNIIRIIKSRRMTQGAKTFVTQLINLHTFSLDQHSVLAIDQKSFLVLCQPIIVLDPC